MSVDDSSDAATAKNLRSCARGNKREPALPPEANQNLKSNSILICRNIIVGGRRTSVRLEPEVWSAIEDVTRREVIDRNYMFSVIASRLVVHQSLASAVRAFIIAYYRESSTESGHIRAGHGSGRPR